MSSNHFNCSCPFCCGQRLLMLIALSPTLAVGTRPQPMIATMYAECMQATAKKCPILHGPSYGSTPGHNPDPHAWPSWSQRESTSPQHPFHSCLRHACHRPGTRPEVRWISTWSPPDAGRLRTLNSRMIEAVESQGINRKLSGNTINCNCEERATARAGSRNLLIHKPSLFLKSMCLVHA